MKDLKALEIAIHQHSVTTNVEQLTTLLHPDFIEIGYSGKFFDLNAMLESLPDLAPDFMVWSQNFEYVQYAPDVIQVNYLSADLAPDGSLSRHAKRTSVWVKERDKWQMRFHQGTPTAVFEKTQ